MKKKPVIGVLPLWDNDKESLWMLSEYITALEKSGGIPLILSFGADDADVQQYIDICDGFLFTGGQDVDPSLYGASDTVGNIVPSPCRDVLELKVLNASINCRKAVLGICRGLQFINAALGGTLYQDLPTQYNTSIHHRQQKPYNKPCHKVSPSGPLKDLLNCAELPVNSLHHQAILSLAPGLKAMAISEDGLIEAAYMPGSPFLWAVQWHPEYLFESDQASQALFRHFIDACRQA